MNERYLAYFLRGIPLRAKEVLDIGCGDGALLQYLLQKRGVARAVGIEPEEIAPVDRSLHIRRQTFQSLTDESQFDLVIMHNSINHLDERAAYNLHRDYGALYKYREIARLLSQTVRPGGTVLITDAARRNFWGDLHLRSPFAWAIGWEYHQSPELWAEVLSVGALGRPEISWIAAAHLPPLHHLLSHRVPAYLLSSQFRLVLHKSS